MGNTPAPTAANAPAAPEVSPGPPAQLLAFVDESMRQVDSATMCYFMAAAVLPEKDCEAVRETLRPLARRAPKRIHWHDEEDDAKELIVKTILAVRVESVVVVCAMIDHRKQERARQQVLKHLLYELDRRAVSHALLESRFPERDRFDLKSIGGFRNGGYLTRRLVVAHGKPLQEPLLWVPDAVAGAAGDHRCGAPLCYEILGDLVEQHDLGSI